MATALRWFVILSAVLQAALIGLFATAALQGDEWGIARAMALLLMVPFLVFVGPALWLMKRNRLYMAASVAGAGVIGDRGAASRRFVA
jgi:hypothetical protein